MTNYFKFLINKYTSKLRNLKPDRGDCYLFLWLACVIAAACYEAYAMITGTLVEECILVLLIAIVIPVPVWICESCIRLVYGSVKEYRKWKYTQEDSERKEKEKKEYIKLHPELTLN